MRPPLSLGLSVLTLLSLGLLSPRAASAAARSFSSLSRWIVDATLVAR